MSHVGNTNLHYNMCPKRMEGTARAEYNVRGKGLSAPRMFTLVFSPEKKIIIRKRKRKEREGSFVPVACKCLPVPSAIIL